MAKVMMKKLTLAAPLGSRDSILDLIQSRECLHIIDLSKNDEEHEGTEKFSASESLRQTESKYNQIKFTYDFLKSHNDVKEGMFSKRDIISLEEFEKLEDSINWEDIFTGSRIIDEEMNTIKGKKVKLLASLDHYRQWSKLDINQRDLGSLRNVSTFIGTLAKKYEEDLNRLINENGLEVYLEKIGEGTQDINIFILAHSQDEEKLGDILKGLGFLRTNLSFEKTPAKEIEAIDAEIIELDKRMEKLKVEAQKLSQNLYEIKKMFDFISTLLERETAISKLLKTKTTFLLQGWVPEENADELLSDIQTQFGEVYMQLEDEKEEDEAPVALKNNAIVEPFEIVTSMYSLPKKGEVDPTPVLAPFFLVFFGMMAADIGYGLVLLVATALALVFMDLQGGTRKIAKLVMYSSIPTMIFGWLYGSFFGGILDIKPIWVSPVDDPMQVLIVSIALGMVHLYVALGVKAYQLIKSGKPLDALWDVGSWYLLITGLVLMLVGPMIGVSAQVAKYIAIAGAVLIVATQGRSSETLVGKFFGGVYGLYGVTGYLGDALSYARLLALGLASGLIGWAFNLLIGLVPKPWVFLAGPLIFLAGHTFNLLIGALGTYVHTSRLQYLEFFGKFYEGGGKPFAPLKISNKFIKVKTNK